MKVCAVDGSCRTHEEGDNFNPENWSENIASDKDVNININHKIWSIRFRAELKLPRTGFNN